MIKISSIKERNINPYKYIKIMFILTWLLKIYKKLCPYLQEITNVIENDNCIKNLLLF